MNVAVLYFAGNTRQVVVLIVTSLPDTVDHTVVSCQMQAQLRLRGEHAVCT